MGLVLAFVACLVLSACATSRLPGGAITEPPLQAAQRAIAHGDFAQAAQMYAAAARRQTDASRRAALHLKAALTALRAPRANLARQEFAAIDPARLNEADHRRYELAQKLLRLAPLPPAHALAQLPPPPNNTPPQLAADIWAARASLLFQQYKYVAGIHNLVQRGVWLDDQRAVRRNNQLIFQRALEAVELGRGSNSAAAQGTDATTLGWLRLAEIRKGGPRGGPALQQALQRWEQDFPGHPATRYLLATVFDYQPSSTPAPLARPGAPLGPGPIMLALPLSGELARPGEAIRAGYETARNHANATRQLWVIDSAPMTAAQIARQARTKGAALIVGPLAKDKVGALARSVPRMPILALNQFGDGLTAPPTFYRYALAPEDDARTAARHAAEHGWHNALVLVPQGDWGTRVLDTFRDAFAQYGGTVVDYAFFDNGQVNHQVAVQAVLQRYHRGAPVDFVFIAAQPFHARMLNSQLRFYHAATLPVIATGDVYAGFPEPRQNADLNGVAFAAMPWVISPDPGIQATRANALRNGDTATKRFPRLFAMGMDAWRLTREWIDNGLQPGTMLPGMTGRLEVLPNGRVRRHLAWAQFSGGLAQLLQPANAAHTMPAMAAEPAWVHSGATLESQVRSTPDGMTNVDTTSGAAMSPPATASHRAQEQPRDVSRQQRASEVSRLIDQADSSADAGNAYTNDGADGDFGSNANVPPPAQQPLVDQPL